MLFFGVFFLAGSGFTVLLFLTLIRPLWRANHVYVETRCVVLDKRIGESRGDDGTTYRPEIHIQYTVGGREVQSWTYDAAGVYSSGRSGKQKIIDQQGTDTRTETKRVYEAELFRNEAFEIQKELPYEAKFDLRVPVEAMHSFEASHNKIIWKLLVKGDIAGWPDFDRDFKLVVVPALSAGKRA